MLINVRSPIVHGIHISNHMAFFFIELGVVSQPFITQRSSIIIMPCDCNGKAILPKNIHDFIFRVVFFLFLFFFFFFFFFFFT